MTLIKPSMNFSTKLKTVFFVRSPYNAYKYLFYTVPQYMSGNIKEASHKALTYRITAQDSG